MVALGHNSPAVHRAYCKNAKVVCPSLIGFGSGGGGEEVNACARGQKNLERSQLESQLAKNQMQLTAQHRDRRPSTEEFAADGAAERLNISADSESKE